MASRARPRRSRRPGWLSLIPSRGHVPQVVIYGRVHCGLCRRAEELVAREAPRASVSTVDVDTSAALVERYGVRVPVVVVDGTEVAELEVAPGVIARAVRAARRAPDFGG